MVEHPCRNYLIAGPAAAAQTRPPRLGDHPGLGRTVDSYTAALLRRELVANAIRHAADERQTQSSSWCN